MTGHPALLHLPSLRELQFYFFVPIPCIGQNANHLCIHGFTSHLYCLELAASELIHPSLKYMAMTENKFVAVLKISVFPKW